MAHQIKNFPADWESREVEEKEEEEEEKGWLAEGRKQEEEGR